MSTTDSINLVEVAAMFAVPRQLAERFVRSQDFPGPTEPGRWSRSEVQEWGRANGRLATV